ncbi:MAG: NADH-quinone oxidoreductase subunit J [Tepidisphaerales bacterium]
MPESGYLLAEASGRLSPLALVTLCALAAVGVGLLLPARRPASVRRLGGALAAAAGLVLMLLAIRAADRAGWGGEVGLYFWVFAAIAVASAVRVVTHPRPVYSALYFVLTVFASAGLFVLLWAQFMAAALVLIYAGAVLVTYVFVIMLAAESTGGVGGEAKVSEADAVSRDPFLAAATGFTLLGVLLLVGLDGRSIPEPVHRGATLSVKAERGTIPPPEELDGSEPLPPGMPFGREAAPAESAGSPMADRGPQVGAFRTAPAVEGDTQQLGAFLYQQQMVAVQLAMLILTLAMTGAVIIARRKVYVPGGATAATSTAADLTTPATPDEDDPHSIPVYGTDDPTAKRYPQT